jgi:hypothetical protein
MIQTEIQEMYLERSRAYKWLRVTASEGHIEEWKGYYVKQRN